MVWGALAGAAARWAGKQLLGSAARRAATTVGGGVVTGIATDAILDRTRGFTPPTLPVGLQGGRRFGPPTPPEGMIERGISRILPGGMSGREYTPVEATEKDKYGRPIAVYPMRAERWQAPSGYVIVYPWASGTDRGQPVAMLKGAARAMGLWSPKPKPVVSGYDTRAIQRAHRAKKRVAKLAKKVAKC